MSYFYISNPYNGTKEQMSQRARIAARTCALLLRNGIHAWSPIVHNHAMMDVFGEFTLEERRSLMLEFDFSLLRAAKGMIVLEIDGWEKSFGVNAEIDLCNQLSIPVKYLKPSDLEQGSNLENRLRNKPINQ